MIIFEHHNCIHFCLHTLKIPERVDWETVISACVFSKWQTEVQIEHKGWLISNLVKTKFHLRKQKKESGAREMFMLD